MSYRLVTCALCVCACCFGQDPTATLEGYVSDRTGGRISGASVRVASPATGLTRTQTTGESGAFAFVSLPVGEYELRITARNFSEFVQKQIRLSLNQTFRIQVVLDVAATRQEVLVDGQAVFVEVGTNALGKVVTAREVLDLPLNGRNFTQLGLLQAGVAPLTAGVSSAGGPLRAGQAYAVNGQRPESNNYLLDGARNVNRADGGFAIRTPIDAIAEFKILTHAAAAEYGGTSGGTTSVITKSGSNEFHGAAYEFLRNDKLDARNFFAEEVEPLKQNQFGATLGGPVAKNRTFFFAYYEGFRNRQGITKAAAVPTPEQRRGDFSGLRDPETGQPVPLINYFLGQPVPENKIPEFMLNPVSLKVLQYYPLGNITPSIFASTQIQKNNSDQAGAKIDHSFGTSDQLNARYAHATGFNINPLSIKGADVPGFPVGDDLSTQLATISETHLFSSYTMNSLRANYFRHFFFFDKRLNRTPPQELGFNYGSSLDIATGPPFFIVNGYASVGNPITGPRRTTQHNYEISDVLSTVQGAHSLKFGGEFRRTQINAVQGIASNGFFVFAPFPMSDSFASFLIGRPVVFFQAGGQLDRGMRNWDLAGFAQDEWRATRRLTVNLGLRYEISTPFADIRNRLNAFVPGQQSTIFPNAPKSILFPGDEGVDDRIAPVYYRGFMPRIGLAWDPTGLGNLSVRSSYGIFYDGFTNGANSPY